MAEFTDGAGRKWVLRITLDTICTLQEKCGIDMMEMAKNGQLDAMVKGTAAGPGLIAVLSLLWIASGDERRGVSLREFRDNFNIAEMEAVSSAVEKAIVEMYPSLEEVTARSAPRPPMGQEIPGDGKTSTS